MKFNKIDYVFIALLAITLFAAILRFYKLGEWSFWNDEVFTLGSKDDGLHLGFLGESIVRYLIKWTVAGLGTSEWTARLVPALIGTLTVLILYFPVRTLFGKNNALIFSGLLAVSPWHIYWSQNARFYVLLLLFGALCLLFLAISLEKNRPWLSIPSLIFFFLAVRESLVALLIIPIAAGYIISFIIMARESLRGVRIRYLLGLLALLGILGVYLAQPYLSSLGEWMASFGRINNTPAWIFTATVYYLGVPIVCIGIFSAVAQVIRRSRIVYLLIFWGTLPVAIIMVLSLFHYTATRYIFISLPAWLILASLAVNELFAQVKPNNPALAVGLIALAFVPLISEDLLYFAYQNGNRENGRAAYQYILQNLQPGDLVVSSTPDVGNYYLGRRTFPMQQMDPNNLGDYRRVWFVEDNISDELYSEQMTWIRMHAMQAANFDRYASVRLFKMRVYLYEQASGTS